MPNYLDEVEERLVELTERGAHRRRGRGAEALAVGGLLAVAAAVALAIAGLGSSRKPSAAGQRPPSPSVQARPGTGTGATGTTAGPTSTATSTATSSPGPAGGPVPANLAPQSFSAISETDWWLLGLAPCASPPCISIVRTTDGGQSFQGLPAPRTSQVSELRFANTLDGFAYGPELWSTHDGGLKWSQISVGGDVTELAAADGWVYAIAGGRLERSLVSHDDWSPLPAAGNAYAGLWVQGTQVLLESSTSTSQRLMVSHDAGQTFASYLVPPSVTCQFQEPQPPVVWAHCATGMLSATWRSTDDGHTFQPSATRSLPGPQLPNSAAFAAASASTAVEGWSQLYRTTDGGQTWNPATQPKGISEWMYLGFTDATHGVGIALTGKLANGGKGHEGLYYTTDGGSSYHEVPIGSLTGSGAAAQPTGSGARQRRREPPARS